MDSNLRDELEEVIKWVSNELHRAEAGVAVFGEAKMLIEEARAALRSTDVRTMYVALVRLLLVYARLRSQNRANQYDGPEPEEDVREEHERFDEAIRYAALVNDQGPKFSAPGARF